MIIGISGKKQHGKDTLAKIIQFLVFENKLRRVGQEFMKSGPDSSNYPGFQFGIFSRWDSKERSGYSGLQDKMFAEKIKQIVCLLIGCTMEQLEDNDFKEKELGEEWRVWYLSNYKLKFNTNPTGRLSGLFLSKEEAIAELEYRRKFFGQGSTVETYILTPRLLLQLIGTDCGRKLIHPNIWINALMSEYKPISSETIGLNQPKKHIIKKSGKAEQREGELGFGYYIPNREDIPSLSRGQKIETSIFEWMESHDNPIYPDWIITDIRFPNEAEAVKDKGGLVFRINRTIISDGVEWIPENDDPMYYNINSGSYKDRKHQSELPVSDIHESEIALDHYDGFNHVFANNCSIDELIHRVGLVLQSYKIIL